MKKLFLAFSFISIALSSPAQTELLTLAENKLNGAVRSVETNVHWLVEKFGEWENRSRYWEESAEFNKAGMLTASSKITESKFEISYKFTYNKSNQLSQWKEVFGKEGEKKKQYLRKYVYDKKGNQTELDFIGDDGDLSWKEKKQYNDDGSIKEAFVYNGDGSLITHSVYKYESGRLVSITEKNAKKEIVKSNEYSYDDEGNRVREESYERHGNIKKSFEWTYDKGNRTSQTKITNGSNGQRIEHIEYNEHGDEISLTNRDDFNRTTVYTYDSHNNWVTATFTFKNSEGKNAGYRMIREIKYY